HFRLPLPLLLIVLVINHHLFFFQAEDGIRDRNVTGVQTCALPILNDYIGEKCQYGDKISVLNEYERVFFVTQQLEMEVNNGGFRSEERRVGKESRSTRPHHL